MLRDLLPILILTIIVLLVWGGFSIYTNIAPKSIDPNASSYVTVINSSFDKTTLEGITKRIETVYVVSPSSFNSLTK